jgi:DNA transformation protein
MMDDSFKTFVLDQLSALPDLRARAMFGGHGLYSSNRFFAILFDGRLYFKVNAATKTGYEKRGMNPFSYEMKGRRMTMSYYEVPPEVLEDRREAVVWASRAIHAAAKKSPRAVRKPAARQRPAAAGARRNPSLSS